MKCPDCGTNNIDNAKFCTKCGTNLQNLPKKLHLSTENQPDIEKDQFHRPQQDFASTVTEEVPKEIRRFSIGALTCNWIWAFANNLHVWGIIILVTSCIAPAALALSIYLGFKGNELAWKAGNYSSIEQFKKSQRPWDIAGIVLLIASLVVFITIFVIFTIYGRPIIGSARANLNDTKCIMAVTRISVALEIRYSEFSDYDIESLDDLAMHINPACKDNSSEKCESFVTDLLDKSCGAENYEFYVEDYGQSYSLTANPSSGCAICATPGGIYPPIPTSCSPEMFCYE